MNDQAHVLVIDDEKGVVQLCQRLLERDGFQVFTALSPEIGLELLRQQPVNLLLVDIRMPGMDGFQVMQLARQQQPDLAVMMITGHGTIELAVEALRGGADGITLKPFTANELLQSVHRALEQNHLKREMSRLHTLQPLFEFTNQLFSEATLTRLRRLVVETTCAHLHGTAALLYEWQPGRAPSNSHLVQAVKKQLFFPKPSANDPAEQEILQALASMLLAAKQRKEPELLDLQTAHGPRFLMVAPATLRIPHSRSKAVKDEGGASHSTTGEQYSSLSLAVVRGYVEMGNLPIESQKGAPFTPADQELLSILSHQAATALENALLTAELRSYIRQLKDSQRLLLQAEKMATAGRLMASIAHEINNPLQAVQNCLHLSRRSDLKPDSRQEYLEMAQTELERLSKTVQRMLDFYRPASIERQPTDIHLTLQRVIGLLSKKLDDSRVQIVYNFDPALPQIPAVTDQLQQVFLNLILNAAEAMPGGGCLTISTSAANKKGIEITFQDNGPGIDPKISKRLFEPFTSAKVGGTGLGLSISYGIIAAHGGTLQLVDPLPARAGKTGAAPTSKGACFRIRLPAE